MICTETQFLFSKKAENKTWIWKWLWLEIGIDWVLPSIQFQIQQGLPEIRLRRYKSQFNTPQPLNLTSTLIVPYLFKFSVFDILMQWGICHSEKSFSLSHKAAISHNVFQVLVLIQVVSILLSHHNIGCKYFPLNVALCTCWIWKMQLPFYYTNDQLNSNQVFFMI